MIRVSGKSDTRILRITLSFLALVLICSRPTLQAADLRVRPNQRYLVRDDQPSFYLCDTGWDVFMMLDRDGADEYLKNPADTGTRDFSAPPQGLDQDWVLALDEAAQRFPIPGRSGRHEAP